MRKFIIITSDLTKYVIEGNDLVEVLRFFVVLNCKYRIILVYEEGCENIWD